MWATSRDFDAIAFLGDAWDCLLTNNYHIGTIPTINKSLEFLNIS